jgi:hypothetical protein
MVRAAQPVRIPATVGPRPRTSAESRVRTVVPHPDDIMADNEKTLADLLAALATVHATHALIGGLAAGVYGKPRATVDVDLLIPERAAAKVHAELARRGHRIELGQGMMRAYRGRSREPVAGLVWREANPVLEAAAAHTTAATVLGLPVRLVKRGAFVALEYHAAISPQRGYSDKHQDVTDIMRVLDKKFGAADEELAVRIAELSYPGAGRDLAALLDDIRHQRPVRV